MQKSLLYLAAFSSIVACSPVYYAPSSQHVPLLTEKDDVSVSADYVLSESTESMALKAAYAVSSHWGLMAGGSFHFRGETQPEASWGDGGYVEAGGGYFTKISRKFVYETYGLLGYGHMSNHFPQTVISYPDTDGILKANLLTVALQPSIGFKSKFFDAALSMKASMLHYNNLRGSLFAQNVDQKSPSSQQEYLLAHANNLLLEPAITLRGGMDFLKLQLQGGGSFNVSHRDFPQDGSWFSFGLVYSPKK